MLRQCRDLNASLRLIHTKFTPPTDTGHLVLRPRLLEKLSEGRTCPLTLIHGPAGFGKTSLAIQWRRMLIDDGSKVAWLSLDKEDNETERFLHYLVGAIKSACPEFEVESLSLLESKSKQATQFVLADIVNGLAVEDAQLFLVLDDWHLITNNHLQDALTFLVERSPECFHLVINSRTKPPLPLTTLRVQSHLTEVDSSELRFDQEESAAFLRDLNNIAIQDKDLRSLWKSTEGWIAALQLALLSIRTAEDKDRLIREFSGQHYSIGEYLVENVLNSLPNSKLDFLLKTSILNRLSADLCNAVSGRTDSQSMLERLEKDNLFIRPLDENMQWFRYHHLFADFLRKRLHREHPNSISSLHQTAAEWFSLNGHSREAVDHAIQANETELAIGFVERDAMYLVEHSFMGTLLNLVDKLPYDKLDSRCELQLAIAWAHCLTHHPIAARKALDRVGRQLSQSDLPDNIIKTEARVVKGCIDIYADKLEGVEDLLQPCIRDPEAHSPWVAVVAFNVVTYVLIHTYRFKEALELQALAEPFQTQTRGPFSGIYGLCFCGIAMLSMGDIQGAEAKFSSALKLAVQEAGEHSHAAQLAGALLGQLLYERNAIEEAKTLLEGSRKLGVEGGVTDFSIASYVFDCRIEALNENYSEAHAILNEGLDNARVLNINRFAASIEAERIRLYCVQGDVKSAEHHLAHLDESQPVQPTNAPGIDHQIYEFRARARARVLASKGENAKAHVILSDLLDDALTRKRDYAHMSIATQLAAIFEADGRQEEAEDILLPALLAGMPQGMVRTFLDEGPRIRAVMERLRERFRRGELPASVPPIFACTLTTLLSSGVKKQSATSRSPISETEISVELQEQLKEREIEILNMLELGRSNKEIAREIYISVDTVKWYLKGIYAKLGVTSRTQAISKARKLNLLS